MLNSIQKGIKGKLYIYMNIALDSTFAKIIDGMGFNELSNLIESYIRESIKREINLEKLCGEIK